MSVLMNYFVNGRDFKILSKSEWKLNENDLVAILAFQMLKVL